MATDTLKSTTGAGAASGGLRRLLLDNGALTALIVLVIAMSALSGDFLTADNLLNVGVQAAVTAILAFGVTFVIVSAGIDLSVGSVAALSATVLAWTATSAGVPVFVAVLLVIATGIACGLVNGILISYGKLPPFIATLAMLSVARGLSLVISEGSPIALPDSVSHLGDTLGGWLPVPVLVMIVMGLIAAFVLGRTYIGRSMYAIGGNEEAARLSGLRVKKQKLAIYALSGVFAAVAGVVLAARLSSAQPQAADGYELDAIAAVVIGGASLAGGTGKASGTLIGALILAVLRNGLNLLNVSAFWQQVVIGVVIALAVLLDTARRKAGATAGAAGSSQGGKGKQAATYGLAAVVTVAIVGATSFLHNGSSATSAPKMGLSLSTLNNPFFVQIRAGAEAEAKKLGIDLTVTDAQNDASQQANQLQNFTSSGLGAIIVNPVDSDAASNSVKAADKADIPVIAVDRVVNNATLDTLVASDNVAGGELAAKSIGEKLGGKGKIVILQGQAGTSAARERAAGFEKGLKAFPGIQVVAQQPADFDRTKGLDVMSNLLQAHPDVQGVIAANDEMALGAIKALGSKAGKSVSVVGFDGTPDGLKAVEGGSLYASVAQQPSQLGKIAVDNALKALKGKKVEETVKVPVKVVTKENVAGFSG
ncbi:MULTISPECIES: substrate-binding domain-containing protein [Streptomyces]|uniref:Substrate-binding domain-containing protein n=1 Tax=Streptomyces koelreuteriae TaxID=2838015 RepID=A0ABX8FWU5_9ACTN|nr:MULTISPECIES: substrate-binding domain-containing protein [Streptomyces]QWB25440.1 substrate-binding domain-containing protein [Streptomyces koelreuteriae]UUA08484.1 substrate-binding domain-containing protein [Streptomyces koelreuteriae]UUA16089.1 substrate-binding domain-containing protein [Streptomyces sp. CRCS-T-1]